MLVVKKMKIQLFIGILLSCIILLLTPLSPTVQFSKAQEASEQMISEDLSTFIVDSIAQEMLPSQSIDTGILSTLVNFIAKSPFIQRILDGYDTSASDDPQPLCFPFLGIFIYGLIAFIILKIVGYIFKYIGSIVMNIVTAIATSIKNVIMILLSVIRFIVQLIITIIQGIFALLFKTGEFVITVIATIVSAILAVILFIINVFVAILQRLRQGYITFLGLILDILMLIYDTIFRSGIST